MRTPPALLFVFFLTTSAVAQPQSNRECRSLGHRNQLRERQV